MNCKPGEMAVIIRSVNGLNLGRIVRVVKIHDSATHDLDGVPVQPVRGPRWVLEKPLLTTQGTKTVPLYTFPDSGLRPLRDPGDDAQDETLNWLPVPTKETA